MTPKSIREIMSPAIDDYYNTVTRNYWNSVSSSPPTDKRFVIVHFIRTYPNGSRKVGTTESKYIHGKWIIEYLDGREYKVTHWMDWPKSPKGFTQDDLDKES